jgi:hypothetical protein
VPPAGEPSAPGGASGDRIRVELTRAQVERAPGTDQDPPISRMLGPLKNRPAVDGGLADLSFENVSCRHERFASNSDAGRERMLLRPAPMMRKEVLPAALGAALLSTGVARYPR